MFLGRGEQSKCTPRISPATFLRSFNFVLEIFGLHIPKDTAIRNPRRPGVIVVNT